MIPSILAATHHLRRLCCDAYAAADCVADREALFRMILAIDEAERLFPGRAVVAEAA